VDAGGIPPLLIGEEDDHIGAIAAFSGHGVLILMIVAPNWYAGTSGLA
jgi:hypothetical protein